MYPNLASVDFQEGSWAGLPLASTSFMRAARQACEHRVWGLGHLEGKRNPSLVYLEGEVGLPSIVLWVRDGGFQAPFPPVAADRRLLNALTAAIA